MTLSRSLPTVALILETNNLRGGPSDPGAERAVRSLERLLRHLAAQTLAPRDLHEIVITHDGLDAAACKRLEAVLGVPIRFILIPPGTGYYEAKNLGFDATEAGVVAFGDADCWPDPAWLERLVAPFADATTEVTAGRTTYRDDIPGIAATAIDFMYFPSPLGGGCTRNFYANNVAFRRDVFAARRYRPAEGTYRGHCQELGLRLARDGVKIRFVPEARTIHRFPDSGAELLRLRLLRGADTVEMAPRFGDALLPSRLRWLGHLGPVSALGVLGVRLGLSARAVGRQDMSEVRGLRRVACLAGVVGISAADVMGAIARSAGRNLGVRDGGLAEGALSYHDDRDRLGESRPS